MTHDEDDANDHPGTAHLVDSLSQRDEAAHLEDENAAREAKLEEENAALKARLEEEKAAREALEEAREAAPEQAPQDEATAEPATSEQPPMDAPEASSAPPARATPGTAPAHGGGSRGTKGPSVGVKAPNGFLWKPVSDSDGRLAVLLPPGLTGQVKEVRVLSPDGSQVLATGRSGGVGNGGREHFRFGAAGGSFPPGCIVQIVMKDGSTQEIRIDQPQMRGEGRG